MSWWVMSAVNDDDDEVLSKKFFKFPHNLLAEHAWYQLLAVGTTPCGKEIYYKKKKNFLTKKSSFLYTS